MSTPFNFASSLLSIAATVLFTLSCFGYSDNKEALKYFSWIISDDVGNAYFGLREVYVKSKDLIGNQNNAFITYSDQDECDENWCTRCYRDGLSAFFLMVLAAFSSILVASSAGSFLRYESKSGQFCNAISAGLTGLMAVIALSMFMDNCYNAIEDSNGNYDNKLEWGRGSILTIIGMFIMWFVAVLQLFAACL